MISILAIIQKLPIIGYLFHYIILLLGVDIPRQVKIGKLVSFPHNSIGTVIHPFTTIEDKVKVYQNVTLGRADIYRDIDKSNMKGIIIKQGAIICAGAKVLCKDGTLIVGRNAIIAANAVLLNSVEDNEIWAGNPAKKVGMRKDL